MGLLDLLREANVRELSKSEFVDLGVAVESQQGSAMARLREAMPAPGAQPAGTDRVHDLRISEALVDGRLRATGSEFTRRALRHFTADDLWLLLRMTNAGSSEPCGHTVKGLRRLKERADEARSRHAGFARALVGLRLPRAHAEAAEAIELGLRRVAAWASLRSQRAQDDQRRIEKGTAKQMIRGVRKPALRQLHAGLGWSIPDLAALILASSDDWSFPPCPDFVDEFTEDEDGRGIETLTARLYNSYLKD